MVRFNNAAGFGGRAGRRATHLALVNHGGQMREWLDDPHFLDRPAVRAASRFLLPFRPKPEPVGEQDADGRDWTAEAVAMLGATGKPVTLVAAQTHAEAARLLRRADGAQPPPSTGFLVTLHFLRELPPDAQVEAHGFGFAGWFGHDWDAERRWFEAKHVEGRLRLIPTEPVER